MSDIEISGAATSRPPDRAQPVAPEHLLLWFDLETTGLDEREEEILEVGWGISNLDLEWIAEPRGFPIAQNEMTNVRDSVYVNGRLMDDFVTGMHLESGLWEELFDPSKTIELGDTEATICTVMDSHANAKWSMAGTGVSQFDMRWVRQHMPRLYSRLTYYSIDLGTYERVASVLAGGRIRPSRNSAAHRSVDDIIWAHNLALEFKEKLNA